MIVQVISHRVGTYECSMSIFTEVLSSEQVYNVLISDVYWQVLAFVWLEHGN